MAVHLLVLLLLIGTARCADAAVYQPDLMVKLGSEVDGSYLGAGVYEPDPKTQFKYHSVPTGTAASFRIMVKNAGDTTDAFVVRGTASGGGFTVRYLDAGGADVTSAVTGGTYRTSTLDPASSVILQVDIIPSELPIGTAREVTVAGTSGSDASRRDSVNLETVTCGSVPGVTITTPADNKGGPGEIVVYPYTVTNVGTGNNSFTIGAGTTAGGSSVIIADDGAGGGIANDGIRQQGEVNPTGSTGALGPGESYSFFVAVTIPQGSVNGSAINTTVNATGTGASASDQVTTRTMAPVISVAENLRNASRSGIFSASAEAAPGETLEYRMTVTNSGAAPAAPVLVSARVPAEASFVAGSLRVGNAALGEGDTCTAATCGTAAESGGEINAFLGEGAAQGSGGTLAPARTLYVFFKVVLQ